MTYVAAVEAVLYDLDKAYNKAGGLRDYANEDEKRPWNNLRGLLQQSMQELYLLKRILHANKRADMLIEEEGYFK